MVFVLVACYSWKILMQFTNHFMVLNTEDKDWHSIAHVVKTLFRIKPHSHITCSVFNLFYIPQETWHNSARVRFIVSGIIKIITNINISLQSVEVIVVLFARTSFTGYHRKHNTTQWGTSARRPVEKTNRYQLCKSPLRADSFSRPQTHCGTVIVTSFSTSLLDILLSTHQHLPER